MNLNDETIKKYEYLVKNNAREMKNKYFELDDLVSFGYIGLMKAIRNYRDNECSFEKWANYCIKTAIYDGMRKEGPFKRKKIENLNLQENSITKKQLQSIQLVSIVHAESYESLNEDSKIMGVVDNQLEQTELYELKSILRKMCLNLSQKEKQVLFLKFYKEYKIKEISKELDLTEARISQIQTKALKKLNTLENRKKVEDYL